MMKTKNPDSSIPELIKSIRYSFRQCEFDEVQNALMDGEKSMKVEIENLVRERDSLKMELESLRSTQGFTELEKCSAEEKLGRSERRCEDLDKLIVRMREDIEKLRGEKSDLEEKVVRSRRKAQKSNETLGKMQKENDKLSSERTDLEEKLIRSCRKSKEKDESLVKMEKEIEELRRENAYTNKSLEELNAKMIEADCIVEKLKRKNVEAVQTIDELRAKKIESDKAAEFYESGLSDLDPRILKLERTIAKILSVNVEDLGCLANGMDNFAAATTDVRVEENVTGVVVSPEVAATSGVGNLDHSRTGDDDANIVCTSKPASNSAVAESNATVQDNEVKEPEVRGMNFQEKLARAASESGAKDLVAEATEKEAAPQEVEPGMSFYEKLTRGVKEKFAGASLQWRAEDAEKEAALQEAARLRAEVEPGSHAGAMQSGGEVAAEKTTASSPAAGNDVIVVSESDGNDGESKRDRRRESAIHRSRKRKRNRCTTTDAALRNVEYVDLEDDSSSSRINTHEQPRRFA